MPAEPRGSKPETELQWLEFEDFSPGIYDYSHIAKDNPNVPCPPGAADVNETHSCIALPKGGLGPLPAVTATYAWPGDYVAGPDNYIVGLLVHDELGDGNTEAVAIFQADDGTDQYWQAWSMELESAVNNLIVQNIEASPGPGLFGSPYPVMSRAAATDPTTTVGNPVIVFPGPDGTSEGNVYMYPDPAAPSTLGAKKLYVPVTNPGVTGQVLAHQSRILVLSGINYPWPIGSGFNTNEQIAYTDPPNSDDLGFQQTVLATEQPYGYGAGGSISAGELFLVKKRGGALVVTGDIFSPNVTILPGVMQTGGIYGSAHSGMAGFVYCSYDNGAWAWNGGSTAQKISAQLDDSFFLPPEFATMASNNYGFYVRCIGDRVYFSGNWFYDLNTQSWWRYYPTKAQGGADLYYTQEVDGGIIYAAQLSFPDTDKTFLYGFGMETPTETWVWQSLPRRLTTDRYVECRTIIVRASSNAGNTDSQITVAVFNGSTQVGSVTTPSGSILANPTMIRLPIGAISAGDTPYASEDITVRISATGNGGAAPNLHSCSIGWAQRTHAPTIGVSS